MFSHKSKLATHLSRPVLATIALSVLVVACSSTEPEQGSNLLASPILLDAAATDQALVSGDIAPLRAFEFIHALADGEAVAELKYVSRDDSSEHSHRVYETSRSAGSSSFNVLFPALTVADAETFDIFVLEPTGRRGLGALTVRGLPAIGENAASGDFSLLAMNSVLIDLRNQIKTINSAELVGTAASDSTLSLEASNSIDSNIAVLNDAIASFQENIRSSHDAVVFNVGVENLDASESHLEASDFELVDSIFMVLSDQLIKESILFDYAEDEIGLVDNFILNTTMPKLVAALKTTYADLDGVAVMSSIASVEMSSSIAEKYSSATELILATTVPSILNVVIADIADDGKVSAGTVEHLKLARVRIEAVQALARLDSQIMENALGALIDLEQSLVVN